MAFRGIWKRAFQLYNFFVLLLSSYITFQVDPLYIQDVAAVLFSDFFVVRCFVFHDDSIVKTTISAI